MNVFSLEGCTCEVSPSIAGLAGLPLYGPGIAYVALYVDTPLGDQLARRNAGLLGCVNTGCKCGDSGNTGNGGDDCAAPIAGVCCDAPNSGSCGNGWAASIGLKPKADKSTGGNREGSASMDSGADTFGASAVCNSRPAAAADGSGSSGSAGGSWLEESAPEWAPCIIELQSSPPHGLLQRQPPFTQIPC